MPVGLDETTKTKISALRTISNNWSEPIEIYELLKINWTDGAVYYACQKVDEISSVTLPVSPVVCNIIAKDEPAHFFEIDTNSALADEEFDLEIWDGGELDPETNEFTGQGEFADLVEANGEGVEVEVFYWIPVVELLLSRWQGHLRTDEESDNIIWRGRCANGFRSPDLTIPNRAHYPECQAIYGGLLTTLEEVAAGDCPHDAHLPGGTVGNADFETCPRKSRDNCTERGIDPLYHLSDQTITATTINGQTSGPQLYSISRGNESNLKEAKRVVMGVVRVKDMQVLAFRRDYNNNNPDHGFFDAVYEACEGPIWKFTFPAVNGPEGTKSASGIHFSYALGTRGQAAVSNALTTHGYSGTALFRFNYGWVNPADCSPESMRGEANVWGLNNIRIYTDEETFTEEWTNNRAWQIARMYCDKRWGYGLDYARLGLESWIETAEWSAPWVTFTDPDGNEYEFMRSISDVELNERSAQDQIEDMCLAGRFSRPFVFQGKIHIAPLRALTEEELEECPVFTDEGSSPNIIFEDRKSTLTRTVKSDLDIPNRIEGTYHNFELSWAEATAPPAEDVEQQLKAGRVMGDQSRRKVKKSYSYLGVVQEGHAAILNWFILYFGAFGEGGIKNNLRIKFKIWYLDSLELHQFKKIRVVSTQLQRYGFEYFQIVELNSQSDLVYEVIAQAHNNEALTDFDIVMDPQPEGGGGGGGGGGEGCILQFGTPTVVDGEFRIPINPC